MRLRARPNRARMQGITELAKWLKNVCEIDPNESCRGTTAVQVLFGRLIVEYGNTALAYHGDHLIVGADGVFAPESIREYIWGVSTEIVTVSDEDVARLKSEAEPTEPMLEVEEEDEEEAE